MSHVTLTMFIGISLSSKG